MAFAIVANSVRIYPLAPETALRSSFEQVLEFQLTAANADAAMDLGVVAAAGGAQGAQIVSLLSKVASLHSAFVLESNRAAAAAASSHTLTGTAAAPIFTYAGGGTTPTAQSYCLTFRLSPDQTPIVFNV